MPYKYQGSVELEALHDNDNDDKNEKKMIILYLTMTILGRKLM